MKKPPIDLPSDVDQPVVEKELPLPHMLIRLIRANTTYFVANRGGFKTTMGIAFYEVDCVYSMPRSTGIICGPSFEHLGDNTLNPLFNALNEDGFENGVHYVLGTKPPPEWKTPHIRVDSAKKYDHMISWHNGTNQFLVSMAKKGSANGISAQWGIFDEIKLMNERDLVDVIFPVFRGSEKHFGTNPLFMSKFMATDKLADPSKIKWILKKRELNDQRKLDVVLSLALELEDLKGQYNQAGINRRKSLKVDINAIEVRLAKLRSSLSFYVEANHLDTIKILGERWYKDKESNLNAHELKVAIRNEDPDRPEDGFYPDFDIQVHGYSAVNDIDPNKAFILAPDYQHSISPIPIAQISKLPGQQEDSLNYVDEVYTLAPEGLERAVEMFCDKYRNHARKVVYYIYDHTAKGKRNDAEEYYKIVVKKLRERRWSVVEIFTGKAPDHYQKFNDTKAWLNHEDKRVMEIRVNKDRCIYLVASITGAPAVVKNGKTQKDKKYEDTARYPNYDQRETTHFSDCFDMINHAVLKLNRIKYSSLVGGSLAFR